MAQPSLAGLARILNATRYSMAGLRAAWVHEAAFRQETLLAAALVPIALWLGRTGVERGLLIGSCLIVLIVELLNSAVESLTDRIGAERHELSGRAKDMGSAAVFLSLSLTVMIWVLIAADRFGF